MLFYCIGSTSIWNWDATRRTLLGQFIREGMIMSIGVPFFVGTFIFIGQKIVERSPNTGIVVTVLGVLGTAFIAFISGFEL
ncbi:MAG: hypothetical protein IPJ74_25255 [Saprospiraceae bacterium]|nr:hypothetical protein [Saprospiraceae bacterium]